jgi:tRNA threonylcarbamoyladenosine modification (KEOPS) complex  Pcc1 subunit
VTFEATVVYSRGYQKLLFVQDGDAAVFVNPPTTAELLPGDRVLIQGVTQQSFRPIVVASAVTLLRHGSLPKAAPATFDELIRAQFDCRLVTVRAKVRAADLVSSSASKNSARLQLLMDGGHIEANVDSDDVSTLKSMLDDEVELIGIAAGRFDDKMQQTGVVLYVSRLADITILERARSRFWSLSLTPLDHTAGSGSRDHNLLRAWLSRRAPGRCQEPMDLDPDSRAPTVRQPRSCKRISQLT